jgi:hypothetical protein
MSGRGTDVMTSRPVLMATVMLVTLLGASACVTVTDHLKAVSAGHTGCVPERLTISNIRSAGDAILWDATCNGKTYLCSDVTTGKSSDEYSCAPAQ